MKIIGAEVRAIAVDFEGVMPATHVVVRLHTDAGIEGLGSASRITPRNLRAMVALMQALAEALIGADPCAPEAIHARLFASPLGAPVTGLERRAASALDVACWDLAGKAAGLPLHKLLGGFRDRLPASANWRLMPGGDRAALARHLDDLLARGFRTVKCPCGLAPLDAAIDHVRFVRERLGAGIGIVVDGNFAWGVRDALRFAAATRDCDLTWLEDPVPAHDHAAMREVTDKAGVPTCAGEVYAQVHEFVPLLAGRCSDIVMIDQDLGITGFRKVAAMAEAHGVPVVNHLAPEVLAHALAAVPNGLIVGLVPWALPLYREAPKIEAGELVLSDRPGLGLTLDEAVWATGGT